MSPSEGHPPVIGLLGGIAAGKTTVAEMLRRLGAEVISADRIGHAVMDRPETRRQVVARWGGDVVGSDGKVDREELGGKVFGDARELAALEAITHPLILAAMRQEIAGERRSSDLPAVVVDAPLLLEAELDGLCDVLVFVDCPREVRLERVAARGWDADELDRREQHQQPLKAKREKADYVLDSNVPLQTTLQQVRQLWRKALGL